MRYTRRQPAGRGRLSLRSRLLAGLITITALFLIVMGVVTTVVLGHIEKNQFDTDLGLTVKESLAEVANLQNGYAAAYINVATRSTGILSGPSDTATDLQNLLNNLLVTRQATAYFLQNPAQTLFAISQSGEPSLTAIWRRIDVRAGSKQSLLPVGENILVVARPDSAAGNEGVLVLAELITGAILLALLGLGGRWLISRGLAPLDRMASTADMITSRGDLTARMPDPGDHAEAGRLAAAINTMLDRIQHAFGARWASEQKVRQFAADASHELRTPLTTIRGYAELYRQGALGPERLPDAMRRIEQEADRMSKLVAELLELAMLDRDAVADATAVEPGRPVYAEAPPQLVAVVDEPRIRQILANLLANVRAYTPPGTAAAVRLGQSGESVVLEVADAGQGMSAEDAARAFDRFHRGASSGNGDGQEQPGPNGRDKSGSGLGLAIVQAIARAHGGEAALDSVPGRGTRVRIWLPNRLTPQLPER